MRWPSGSPRLVTRPPQPGSRRCPSRTSPRGRSTSCGGRGSLMSRHCWRRAVARPVRFMAAQARASRRPRARPDGAPSIRWRPQPSRSCSRPDTRQGPPPCAASPPPWRRWQPTVFAPTVPTPDACRPTSIRRASIYSRHSRPPILHPPSPALRHPTRRHRRQTPPPTKPGPRPRPFSQPPCEHGRPRETTASTRPVVWTDHRPPRRGTAGRSFCGRCVRGGQGAPGRGSTHHGIRRADRPTHPAGGRPPSNPSPGGTGHAGRTQPDLANARRGRRASAAAAGRPRRRRLNRASDPGDTGPERWPWDSTVTTPTTLLISHVESVLATASKL